MWKPNFSGLRHWLAESWFKVGLLFVAFIAAAAMYQAWVIIPRDKIRQERIDKRSEKVQRDSRRDSCFSLAESEWSTTFKLNSDPVPGKDGVRTWHSSTISDAADRKLKDAKDLCLKQYPPVEGVPPLLF